GAPVAVSLVQGNIPQDLKFEAAYRDKTLATYAELVGQAKGQLIVLPESALPMFADEVPVEFVAQLRKVAQERGGDLLVGLFFFRAARPRRRRRSLLQQRRHHRPPPNAEVPQAASRPFRGNDPRQIDCRLVHSPSAPYPAR